MPGGDLERHRGEQVRQYPCNGAVNQRWTLWS
ncbi:RICIN domain-containing protein [Streptomyces showdoensis]